MATKEDSKQAFALHPSTKVFTNDLVTYIEELLNIFDYIEDLAEIGLGEGTYEELETALLIIKHVAADPMGGHHEVSES